MFSGEDPVIFWFDGSSTFFTGPDLQLRIYKLIFILDKISEPELKKASSYDLCTILKKNFHIKIKVYENLSYTYLTKYFFFHLESKSGSGSPFFFSCAGTRDIFSDPYYCS